MMAPGWELNTHCNTHIEETVSKTEKGCTQTRRRLTKHPCSAARACLWRQPRSMAMTHMRQLHRLRWHQSTDHMEVWPFSLAWSVRSVANWTRAGHLRRPALWDWLGELSTTEDLLQSAWPHPLIRPATEKHRKETGRRPWSLQRQGRALPTAKFRCRSQRGGPRNFRRSWSRRRGDCARGSLRRRWRSGFARRGNTRSRRCHVRGRKRRSRSQDRGRERRSRSHDGGHRRKEIAEERHCLVVRRCVDSAMVRMDDGVRREAERVFPNYSHVYISRFSHT